MLAFSPLEATLPMLLLERRDPGYAEATLGEDAMASHGLWGLMPLHMLETLLCRQRALIEAC